MLLKYMLLWLEGFFFHEKKVFWDCFEALGLNNIFHLHPHCHILDRSSLRDSDKELTSWTTEKIEVLSAKSLTFEVSPSGKSLIKTKNNKGPRTEPCRTPALICDYFEVWTLRRTLWGLSDKNESISPKYFPHTPIRLSLYKRPPCQTLSNALDKCRKTPFTSNDGFASNAL